MLEFVVLGDRNIFIDVERTEDFGTHLSKNGNVTRTDATEAVQRDTLNLVIKPLSFSFHGMHKDLNGKNISTRYAIFA